MARTLLLFTLLAMAGCSKSAPEWTGERLEGPRASFAPRISPDGRELAFLTIADGQSQVARMSLDTGKWNVLTRSGGVSALSWSADGASIYFDHFFDVPRGVYRVPAAGGEEQLVLADAGSPLALRDGSLVVVRLERTSWRLYRCQTTSGAVEALNAVTVPFQNQQPLRATPDGREVIFYGRPADAASDTALQLHALDLETGRAQPIGGRKDSSRAFLSGFAALAVPDNRGILLNLPNGDLQRVVRMSRNGELTPLFTLTQPLHYLSAGPEGNIYLDQWERLAEILRIPVSGGEGQRVTRTSSPATGPQLEISGGRVVTASTFLGRQRLVVITHDREPAPLLDTPEETGPGVTLLNERELAIVIGRTEDHTIAVVSAADGKIIRKLEGPRGQTGDIVASSPDGRTLYYTYSGAIWAVPSADGRPQKVRDGNGVVVDPRNGDLIIQDVDARGVHLVRRTVAGRETEIQVHSDFRLTPDPLSPNAVGRDGRILVEVIVPGSWFWGLGILDPASGKIQRVETADGDVDTPGWTRDGKILLRLVAMRSSLWRFHVLSGDTLR